MFNVDCKSLTVTITLALLFSQYKVLSVLPGSGMGISIATPSTQKVVKPSQVKYMYITIHIVSTQKIMINICNILIPITLLSIHIYSTLYKELEDNIVTFFDDIETNCRVLTPCVLRYP